MSQPSLLDQARPLTALTEAGGVVWIIYGKAGVGKTTLAASIADAPGMGPVLFLSTDRSIGAVAHRPDIAGLVPQTWAELGQIWSELSEADPPPYRTVVLDTLSEAVSWCLDATLRESGHKVATTDDYAQVNKRVISLIRRFRDLALTKGINILFTAWETETDVEDDGRKYARIQPDFSARVTLFAPAAADALMRLTIIRAADGSPKRVLWLRTPSTTLTKLRVPPSIPVPERLDDPTLPKLLTLLHPSPTPATEEAR